MPLLCAQRVLRLRAAPGHSKARSLPPRAQLRPGGQVRSQLLLRRRTASVLVGRCYAAAAVAQGQLADGAMPLFALRGALPWRQQHLVLAARGGEARGNPRGT